MLLKEFMYTDKRSVDFTDNNRYLSQNDTSVLRNGDTRKTRLTLKMINEIRKAGEAHAVEKQEDLGLVRKMYAVPQQPPA